ncbi:hypothetical protein LPJ53_004179 [Coemansia erecta]|uniref:C2H2-type domain-containing protein n=1 Tax=Coemansia erecta TaxID=147472 RepID=A0A9W7XZK9_9FUNG|nr:hypothetical protein LPJ53_004179 [Coemansia erecta]
MAKPEQATGPKIQQLTGFATSSPFSQPPKVPSPGRVAIVHSTTASPVISSTAQHMSSATSRQVPHERLPGPASFMTGGSNGNSNSSSSTSINGPEYGGAFNGARRASGMPPEKTPVGRSGVFGDGYGGDPFYRRHSLDMGAPMSDSSHYSPPRHRLPHPLQTQQQLQHQHMYGNTGRYGSRSGAASPHPLSIDQTAVGLSSSGSGESGTGGLNSRSGSGSNSPGDRGIKRSAPEDDDSMSPGPHDDDEHLQPGQTSQPGVATAEKPYACDQCELTFSRQHNLKSHALTHSTERPFSCPICETPFRRQHDLKRHMKLHTGEKPHTCTNCGRSFARLDALNRHMRAENFHACNQAAKKARTAVISREQEDPRMKSVTAAYMEQRRASTTGNAQGGAGWSHWTHRPSIAADEAMLRRMQERFGAASSYPHQSQQSQPQQQQQYYNGSKNGSGSRNGSHQQQLQPPPPPPPNAALAAGYGPSKVHAAAPSTHQQQQQPQPAKPWSIYGGGPPSMSQRQAPLAAPQQQQQQQPVGGRPRHGLHSGGSPNMGTLAAQAEAQQPEAAGMYRRGSPERSSGAGNVNGNSWQGGANSSAGASVSGMLRPPQHQHQHQQQPPPPLSVTHSHPQPNPSHPHASHMRLPPIDLGGPRRHSLAVTSHLERYRARDATPPPNAAGGEGSMHAHNNPTLAEESEGDGAGANAAPRHATSYHQHVHGHVPLSTIHQSPREEKEGGYGGRTQQMSPLAEGRPLGAPAPYYHQHPAAPMPASFANYTPSVRPPGGPLQTPPKTGEAPSITVIPPSAYDHAEGHDSRRGSAFSGASLPAETRRSSIIALTNPQTEGDVRLENAELKRRLDEMETRYMREIERLNAAVRELEVEKSMLRSMLRGGRAETSPDEVPLAQSIDGHMPHSASDIHHRLSARHASLRPTSSASTPGPQRP